MGAEPWEYFVPYEPGIQVALDKLRRREFEAGRFRGSEMNPRTMEEAVENTGPDGTGSILDMTSVSESADFRAVAPLSKERLMEFFGTETPTHEMIEANMEFFDDIERGWGVYIVAYRDGNPSEIFFGGYSFD